MKLEVVQVNKNEKADKHGNKIVVFKTVLKGETDSVKIKLELESEILADLDLLVPCEIGEQRQMTLKPLNHTLEDYTDKVAEHETQQQDEAYKARLKAAKDAGIKGAEA